MSTKSSVTVFLVSSKYFVMTKVDFIHGNIRRALILPSRAQRGSLVFPAMIAYHKMLQPSLSYT